MKSFLLIKNSTWIFALVILLHIIQQHEVVEKRFTNIKNIKEDKIKENFFWERVKDSKINGYVLTSNDLCNKTIIYGNLPILFCFDALDIIPLIPKLASPIREMTDDVLDDDDDNLFFKAFFCYSILVKHYVTMVYNFVLTIITLIKYDH